MPPPAVCYSTIGGTGGAATVTLTAAQSGVGAHTHTYNKSKSTSGSTALTIAQMPKHAHNISLLGQGNNKSGGLDFSYATNNAGYATVTDNGGGYIDAKGSGSGHTHSVSTESADTGSTSAAATSAHNNMPPYYVAYIWRRTA